MNLFIYDKLIVECKKLNIPLQFVCFARVEGKLYKRFREKSPVLMQNASRRYGGNMVYGAIFNVDYFTFYSRLIDSYYSCSKDALGKNHQLDLLHRIDTKATPIFFNTLDEFASLSYREADLIDVQTYVGNPTHPQISRSIRKSNKYGLVDKRSFITLWEGVNT